jgi:integrase
MPKRKLPPGTITIVVTGERLRLRVPACLLPSNKPEFISLELEDTPVNRLIAEARILAIRSDLLNGEFDTSLCKYGGANRRKKIKTDEIGELWLEYLKYKEKSVKASHYDHLAKGLGKFIQENPNQKLEEALAFREWLLDNTTIWMSKRILMYCNAAVEWGIKNKLVCCDISPYAGMAEDLPKHKWEREGNPNAFTLKEINQIRVAFAEHENVNINNYALFVDFLFLTGCRPSEAIGIRVKDIAPDRSHILFNGGIVRVQGQEIRTVGSKNNKSRKFPINADLLQILDESIWENSHPDDLVFTSISGKTIRYSYFLQDIWKPIVKPIVGRDSSPYSCRDSFITHQLMQGIAPSTVCAWCDTSIKVIQKRYLDPSLALEVQPVNF